MQINIGKCGCDCCTCPTYKANIRTIEDRKKCSAGWTKYLNIKLSPEKLRACDGCSIPDSERNTYYLNCIIRKCAMLNEIENCAYCSGFPCPELLKVHSIQKINNQDEFTNETGIMISENDYRLFIEPYAGLNRLNKIKKTLCDKDYRDYQQFSTKGKFAPFIDFAGDRGCLKVMYALLTTIGVEQNISFARQQTLKRKREQLLKILWTIFYYGTPSKSLDSLELDAKTFLAQKISAMYNALLEYFSDLKKYDIQAEVIPLIEKGWLTPRGGLREKGWIIRLRFGESLGGFKTLAAFKNYVIRLEKKYGNKAYRLFNMADVRIMGIKSRDSQ